MGPRSALDPSPAPPCGPRGLIRMRTTPLERVNEALEDLREGRFTGAAVVTVS